MPTEHGPERTIHRRKRSGSRGARAGPARIMPRTRRSSGAGPQRRSHREPRRDLHRFRVRPGPGARPRPPGITIVPAASSTSAAETYKAGVDLSTEAFWERMTAPGRAVPDDRGRRRPASSRTPTRRRSRPAPRRSSRSTWRARCRARSRAPRSRATCCPDREIHVVDSQGASMAEGILCRMGVELAAEGRSAAEIAETLETAARRHAACTSPSRRSSTSSGAAGSAAPRRRSGRCCRSSRSSRSRTAWSRPPTACAPGRKARERLVELITERADRAAGDPAHAGARRRGVPRRGARAGSRALDPATVDDRARRGVGRAAPRAGLRRRRRSSTGPDGRSTARRSHVAARLRQPCGPVPSSGRRIGDPRLYSAPQMSRASTSGRSAEPRDAPRGVVRETTHTDTAVQADRLTRRILRP